MNIICPFACRSFPKWDEIHNFLDLMSAGNHRVTFPIGQSSATSDIIGQLLDYVYITFPPSTYTTDIDFKQDDYQRYQLSVIIEFTAGGEEE